MARAAISIGSNLGEPAANVRAAITALRSAGNVSAVSRLYQSKPWGVKDQPAFINAVAIVETLLGPRQLLTALQKIERALGRTLTYRWGPRVIDLDIVYYDDIVVDEADLKIPHPHFAQRSFVLVPLAELDPRYAEAAARIHDPQDLQIIE